MQINSNPNSIFPDQVVPDAEKATMEYGLQVGRAVEGEWFSGSRYGVYRFSSNYNNFHNLRLYARGEQPVQKYKDELAINGDLSYLNLDWKPVPVISKFVDIVVNGMSQKSYEVKAFAQDPESLKARTKYAEELNMDIQQKELQQSILQSTGIDLSSAQGRNLNIENEQELEVHMQMDYKQSVEVAEEEVINNVLDFNKYELIKRRFNYDLTVLGIAAVKTDFNLSEGITVDYVDPANLVYSYTDDPNFEDIYYVGEVKSISLPELKKEFSYLTDSELEEIQKYTGNENYLRNWNGRNDNQTIQVLYFEYKTYANQVFKIKKNENGFEKALEKSDTFDPPENDNFKKVFRSIEVLYSGAKILGHNKMLKWELAKSMTRPEADTTKVNMNYNIVAPRMYKGRIQSLVSRITGFADMIQLTHLKLQQVMSRIVPDGVYLDMDGLAEVDLGNGTNYNPAEALNMYFQTGSIVGRSLTQDGDPNMGKVPIQELQSSSGQGKIGSLINTYQYYLQMIRDVTGLNEARDGSQPDRDALVGLQKMAANASNTATKHLMQASLYLTLRTCENISLRVADALAFPLTKNALQNSISTFNIKTLEEIVNLNLHDFGIFLELEPDEEEQAQLEQNIQASIQQGGINLEDAIDLRQIKNLKLANQMLKIKRKEKQKQDAAIQQANIAAQGQAQADTAEKTAMAEVQKQEAVTSTKVQFEQSKNQMEIERMQIQNELEMQKMQRRFEFDLQLKQLDMQAVGSKEQMIEDRKDRRIKMEGTQQSEMISQRKNDGLPIDFENQPDAGMSAFM